MRVLKLIAKVLIGLILILAVFVAYQFIMYRIEGGVFVADKYSDPPLSERLQYRYKPLTEAVTLTRSGGSTGREIIPYMHWTAKWAYWNALRKFPTQKHCLKRRGRESLDFEQFNWKALRTRQQAQLCIFHAAEHFETPEKTAEWLVGQGFGARANSFSIPFPGSSVRARWRHPDRYSLSPFSVFSEFGLEEVVLRLVTIAGIDLLRKIRIHIVYYENKTVLRAKIYRSFK